MPEAKSTRKIAIVGEQVAAARKLLKMTQIELASETGLTEKTIVKFERGGNVRPETIEAIRTVLLDRGIEFTNGGEPGVKLRSSHPEFNSR